MPTFRNRPSRRRERGLTASTVVTGYPVHHILHGDRRAFLLPVRVPPVDKDGKPKRAEDHRDDNARRYAVGMRLAVKEMVPGPTAFHVRVTDVKGKRERFTLGQIDRPIAKELGHIRLDVFWRAWILNHDQAWFVDELTDDGVPDERIDERFKTQWADKLAWFLRFDVIDTVEEKPRYLARGGGTVDVKAGADNRWVHAPRPEDQERESDHGYTGSPALAADDVPTLSDEAWGLHIGPKSPYRIAERVASRKGETWQARYAAAKEDARERKKDIRSECRRFDLLMAQGKMEKAMRQLGLIEDRVFPVAA